MSLLLNSERSLAASRLFSPLTVMINWTADLHHKRTQRANLLSLLEMEDHRLKDLGLTRQDIQASLKSGRVLRRSRALGI